MEQVYAPAYQKLFNDSEMAERQTQIAKNAMQWARKKLDQYKNANEQRLPQAELLNLRPEAIELPSRQTRHVTIAISGFLTQDMDKNEQWEKLLEHLRDSNTALYDYCWESQMPSSVGQGLLLGIRNAVNTVTSFVL